MFDGFFPQTSHDHLYNKRLLGFLLLIPITRESKLLQTVGSHVVDPGRSASCTRGCVLLVPGADPGFFLGGGGALVSCCSSTPINHIVFFFFLQNTSCIRKPQVISGGGGGAHPLDPPLSSILVVHGCIKETLFNFLYIFNV